MRQPDGLRFPYSASFPAVPAVSTATRSAASERLLGGFWRSTSARSTVFWIVSARRTSSSRLAAGVRRAEKPIALPIGTGRPSTRYPRNSTDAPRPLRHDLAVSFTSRPLSSNRTSWPSSSISAKSTPSSYRTSDASAGSLSGSEATGSSPVCSSRASN